MTKTRLKVFIPAILTFIAVTVSLIVYSEIFCNPYSTIPLTEARLNELSTEKCDKLMIVAHPDDETLWGGAHISHGGYLVVCITNGNNKERSSEFCRVVENAGCIPLILSYPDKVAGARDNWKKSEQAIRADIDLLLSYKNWELVVTHNADGEYGHIHHIMTSSFVHDEYNRTGITSVLYNFGKYYKKKNIESAADLQQITPEELRTKEKLLSFYTSQESTTKKFRHMYKYESWDIVS